MKKTRYHINDKGEWGVCTAKKGRCPFSNNPHFDSYEELMNYFEQRELAQLAENLKNSMDSQEPQSEEIPEPSSCYNCGEPFSNEELTYLELYYELVCQGCLEEVHEICDRCGKYAHEDDVSVWKPTGELLCKMCRNEAEEQEKEAGYKATRILHINHYSDDSLKNLLLSDTDEKPNSLFLYSAIREMRDIDRDNKKHLVYQGDADESPSFQKLREHVAERLSLIKVKLEGDEYDDMNGKSKGEFLEMLKPGNYDRLLNWVYELTEVEDY